MTAISQNTPRAASATAAAPLLALRGVGREFPAGDTAVAVLQDVNLTPLTARRQAGSQGRRCLPGGIKNRSKYEGLKCYLAQIPLGPHAMVKGAK